MCNKSLICSFSSLSLLLANNIFYFMPKYNIVFIILAIICGFNYIDDIYNKKWTDFFISVGIINKSKNTPRLISKQSNNLGVKYIFNIPIGFCFKDFEKIKNKLEQFLKEKIMLDLTNDFNLVVQIYQNDFKNEYKPILRRYKNLKYPIGVEMTINGEKEVILDLNKGSHTLIGGINGSGKTTIAKTILTYACLNSFEVKILDMKMGGDYNIFKNYKYLTAFVKDVDFANKEIEKIKNLMKKRFEILDNENIKDYKEYNKRFIKNKMDPLIVMIDEYTMLSTNKNFNNDLNIILAMSRAVNIKIVLSVQRPCRENLNTKLKANLNNTIACMCKNTYNSEILLDKGDYRAVTDLNNPGEAILYTDSINKKFKAYYLTDNEIKNVIKFNCFKYNVLPFKVTTDKNKKRKKAVNLID